MNNQESYESLLEQYNAIPREEVKEPNLPIDIANNEALYLCEVATREKALLVASGLQVSLIDDLPNRVGGLRYSQSLWNKVYSDKSSAESEWSLISEEAFELRDELLHYCKYAYRKDKKLMDTVYRISEGATNADMVQDLLDLSVLGKENSGLLTGVGCDITKLDRAEQLAEQAGAILAKVNDDRNIGDKPAKEMRDRAFTYLKQAVDSIREAGRFVHWKDKEKAAQYASQYFREVRENQKKEEAQNV